MLLCSLVQKYLDKNKLTMQISDMIFCYCIILIIITLQSANMHVLHPSGCWTNRVLMLYNCLRRWASIKTPLAQRFAFSGSDTGVSLSANKRHWVSVGPPSATLAQYSTSIVLLVVSLHQYCLLGYDWMTHRVRVVIWYRDYSTP